jgi:hypothetical protein
MLIMVREILCITSMLVVLTACDRSSTSKDIGGGASEAGAPNFARMGSCDRASATGTCSEYSAQYLTQNELLVRTSCARLNGTFVHAECPNTSVVGACTLSSGEVRKFYGTGANAYQPSRARAECETSFRGAWQGR